MPAKNKTGPPPASPVSKISPPRQVAFQILRELATSANTHSDDLLQGTKVNILSPQDRNLCTNLVMGVLRWQLTLDAIIAPLLTHKGKMDEPVRIALRMGVFQLVLLDRIPVHAAISDSVELTKRAGHRFASGLVNAVLRKVVPQATALRDGMQSQSAHPAWLVERWTKRFGLENVAAICDYDQQQPQAMLRLITQDAETKLQKQGVSLEPGAILNSAVRVHSGSSLTQADDFRWQDEGSQLIAELLGGISEPKSILDCCAAPGGKTAILAERNLQARVVACDVSASRLAKMRERFEAAPALANIVYQVSDVALMPVDGTYDLILCDVPCSGTGTLARNPEIKLRLQLDELSRQQERQVAILVAALHHLAPGGRLVYSTCSLEQEEGEAVVERVMEDAKEVRLLPIAQRIHELASKGIVHTQGAEHLLAHAVQGNFLRTIPGVTPCDGFFAALLTRD